MANKVCSRTASVTFWHGYAPWYKWEMMQGATIPAHILSENHIDLPCGRDRRESNAGKLFHSYSLANPGARPRGIRSLSI